MEELFLISIVAVFLIGLIGIKARHYLLKLSQHAWAQRKQQTAYIEESEKLQQSSGSSIVEQQNYERLSARAKTIMNGIIQKRGTGTTSLNGS